MGSRTSFGKINDGFAISRSGRSGGDPDADGRRGTARCLPGRGHELDIDVALAEAGKLFSAGGNPVDLGNLGTVSCRTSPVRTRTNCDRGISHAVWSSVADRNFERLVTD